jgi:methylmalonyl-CoA mutase C-terminal domain/subunit
MVPEERKIRVLLTKSGLDMHDRGARTVAQALRDGGIEVIYARYFTPEDIVTTAIQEDVDIIAVSSSCVGYMYDVQEVQRLLQQKGKEVPLVLGGAIDYRDIPELERVGVRRVFGSGSPLSIIVEYIRGLKEE